MRRGNLTAASSAINSADTALIQRLPTAGEDPGLVRRRRPAKGIRRLMMFPIPPHQPHQRSRKRRAERLGRSMLFEGA